MTVVYLDIVFLLNGVLDYLLLLMTARLAGLPLRRGRYLLSAVLGGCYAVGTFLPDTILPDSAPALLGVWAAMAVLAFWREEKLPRLALLWALLSCGLAGVVLAAAQYAEIGLWMLLVAAIGIRLLLATVFRSGAEHGLRGELLPVRLWVDGKWLQLTALYDSGNCLTDPETGEPVLVLSPGAAVCCPEREKRRLSYRSVGMEEGALVSFLVDAAEIDGVRYRSLRVAVSPVELGNGYTALWGGRLRRRRYEKTMDIHPADADPVGVAAITGHLVHRRQRYTAAAAEPGAGDGTAGASGG